MKLRRHLLEQQIWELAEGDKPLIEGLDFAEVCRNFGIAESEPLDDSMRRQEGLGR